MTASELHALYLKGTLNQAEIIRDSIMPGWLIEFRDVGGRIFELTDTLGCPVSFTCVADARERIHRVADCPIQEDHLYRFYDR